MEYTRADLVQTEQEQQTIQVFTTMPKTKKKDGSSRPGQALIKRSQKEKRAIKARMRQTDEEIEEKQRNAYKSVTELNNLENFLEEAELAGREFETDREAKVFQFSQATGTLVQMDEEIEEDEMESGFDEDFQCSMPRRPDWKQWEEENGEPIEAQDLEQLEKQAFLVWRKELADMEKRADRLGYVPSPFEKNLNFWRQLWRVLERSHVLVQVVDARNPLLFRFEDLERYALEISPLKRLVLVVNKADLLPDEKLKDWKIYFANQGVQAAFFTTREEVKREGILSSTELLDYLQNESSLATKALELEEVEGVVGMVGYPNVGKSSLINALLGGKKVSVSSTPGHTKHFQTMRIEDRVTLCDCPGLVFPSFFASKAEMLCNGILPIDEIRGRDFMPALEYICSRVPKLDIERTFHVKILEPASWKYVREARKFLESFCELRGLYAQGPGRLDEARGSRLILKDFVMGKLLYCHSPPGTGNEEEEGEKEEEEELQVTEAIDLLGEELLRLETEEEVLFHQEQVAMHQPKPSRRLARHGRKHRKGMDKNPYDHPIQETHLGARVKGGREFTRNVGYGKNVQ